MDWKHLAAKTISAGLIIFSLYQILLSINSIFFVYPELRPQGAEIYVVQEGLIGRAIIIYLSMITNAFYGTLLLFKSAEEIKIIHVIIGASIFVISFFTIAQNPFTSDPLQIFISQWLEENWGLNPRNMLK